MLHVGFGVMKSHAVHILNSQASGSVSREFAGLQPLRAQSQHGPQAAGLFPLLTGAVVRIRLEAACHCSKFSGVGMKLQGHIQAARTQEGLGRAVGSEL